ncbi:MAG: molybdenum cofactor guanylyltransferase MobA [Inhella sp.]|jgi:molybdopterin-guanine dinucleotide biosynthesis protein A|uniref:molybdenum cofactor guanylyltransferase MobA n=1 Tax=Inhella sp. TaxID=1921806 RepID=UPI0022C9ECEB|nr:molybdenum cofactor guanylyltransferase MobA [Inhella sp.]MCZ8234133.1 molybdenum cofactor guanylyltransferase [Inhella sp.]
MVAPRVLGVVLAGGRGQRMGGADKGLLPWGDAAMVDAVLARLGPQVDALAIVANRNPEAYAQRGHPVWSDDQPQAFEGPLAGWRAALAWAQAWGAEWVQFSACDTPHLPTDLCLRLRHALGTAPAAYPQHNLGPEPAHALVAVAAAPALDEAWRMGERSLRGALQRLGAQSVAWHGGAGAFANCNAPDALGLRQASVQRGATAAFKRGSSA